MKLCTEALTSSLDAGTIAGGVSAVLLLLVFIVIVLVCVKRRRQNVKETIRVIHNKLYSNEEDVTFRAGIVPDREPYVLVEHCKRYT